MIIISKPQGQSEEIPHDEGGQAKKLSSEKDGHIGETVAVEKEVVVDSSSSEPCWRAWRGEEDVAALLQARLS